MELLKKLEEKKDDDNFLQKFEETKLNGKRKLASFIPVSYTHLRAHET